MTLIDILVRMDGRIGRKSFWIGTIVLTALIIAGILALIAVFGEDVLDGPNSGGSMAVVLTGPLSLIVSIPLILKRLHDLNRSYRLLVPAFVFEALAVAGELAGWTGTAAEPNALGWGLTAVYGIYALALLIHLGFYRGTKGHNDFGPDPLAPEEIPASVTL